MAVPSPPTNVRANGVNHSVVAWWGKPSSNGGHAITAYVAKLYTATDDKFVKQIRVSASTFQASFNSLPNAVVYYVKVYAYNSAGASAGVRSATDVETVGPISGGGTGTGTAVTVTITKIGPNKIPNTRPGQSPPDAPKLLVNGTNLAQAWVKGGASHLEWVLYTSTALTTVAGTDSDTVYVTNMGSTSFTISAPVAPAGAHIDSNGLIGPWRLKATYVPDPLGTASAVAWSPTFYTTAVGSLVLGSVTPNPAHDSDVMTVVGTGIGICTKAVVTIGGNTLTAPTTRVDANTVTFIMPTFGYDLEASGTVQLEYTLNGNVLLTSGFAINWDPAGTGASTGGDTDYTPPSAATIPRGVQPYPLLVKRWKFTDPATGDTYTVPRNPDAMTSPFPQRTITTKFTTAINGQLLLWEGSPTPMQWEFSGTIVDAAHYEQLRHWVNDLNQRIRIEDHFGRVLDCVLQQFNPVPKRDIHRLWSHTYTITGLVIAVGTPTEVPA